jgi:hypothetical protein
MEARDEIGMGDEAGSAVREVEVLARVGEGALGVVVPDGDGDGRAEDGRLRGKVAYDASALK